jgi:predicted Rossmann-fold nucleotide-binding protein
MRYAVFGPREYRFKVYDNKTHVAGCLGAIPDLDVLISGGGRGIEALAEEYARDSSIEIVRTPPNYQGESGVSITTAQAFDNRNIAMIADADGVVMFWDGTFAAMVPIMSRCMFLQKKVVLYPMI